jgi:3-phenylpropionate/cinnamic acid dioxygenase small subunit
MTDSDQHRRDLKELLIRYATAIDTKNWDLLEECFVGDARFGTADFILTGREAIVTFMRAGHNALDGSRHRLSNIAIDVNAAAATARTSTYLDAILVQATHPDGPTFQVIGTYLDTMRYEHQQWRIAERRFQRLWTSGNARLMAKREP